MDEAQFGDSAKENETSVKSDSLGDQQQAEPKKLELGVRVSEANQSQKKAAQRRRSLGGTSTVQHHRTYYCSKKQYSEPRHDCESQQCKNVRTGTTAGSARERRTEFADRRVKSTHTQEKQHQCVAPKASKMDKTHSLSISVAKTEGTREEKKERKPRNRNTTTDVRTTSHNSISNGESFDFDDMELDEPFSESEDESSPRMRGVQKPCLIIPRGRIRSLSGTIPPVGFSPHWGGPTMCLSCLQFFQLPEMLGDFSVHLLTEHQTIIDGMDIIVDLKRYIEHWRQQFAKRSIADIFPKIHPKNDDVNFGKVDFYFLMNEEVKEDYALRQNLAMRRLEEALACQQREREDCAFSMQCIFCRYIARGNRAKIIHHLYTIHHLNLGSPDNLVFVTEYIEHLREKLLRNECIYCEKTYADRNTLMEHMRKKNHREVNPKNNYYDKFYIINYLELGKRWLDVLAEDFEDTMPTFVDSDEEEEEESWHEWQEDNAGEDELCAVCLFCNHSSEQFEEITKHMNDSHKFDMIEHMQEQGMNTYDRMKFVNFLRRRTFNTRTGPTIEGKYAEIPEREEWDRDESLVPMFGNDHLLWMLESWYLEQEIEKEGNQKFSDTTATEVACTSSSTENNGIPKVNMGTLIEESMKNTVEGVVAEDLPDLTESVLANNELQQALQ